MADLAESIGFDQAFSAALVPSRVRGGGHDPGRMMIDLAVVPANGSETIADPSMLRDRGKLFGRSHCQPPPGSAAAANNRPVRLSDRAASSRHAGWHASQVSSRGCFRTEDPKHPDEAGRLENLKNVLPIAHQVQRAVGSDRAF